MTYSHIKCPDCNRVNSLSRQECHNCGKPLRPGKPTSPTQDNDILYQYKTAAATLLVKEEGITIKRPGGAFATFPAGERFILFSAIKSLQFQPPGWSYGYVYFQLNGMPTTISGFEAPSNPNCIIIQSDELPQLEKAKSLIESKISSQIVVEQLQQPIPHSQPQTPLSYQPVPEPPISCPKCGSIQITSNKKGFHLGQAAAGAILTGGVGLLAGFWGSNNIRLNCLKCGNRWVPKPPQ